MKLFGGTANYPLAEKIAKHLSLPVSALDMFIFPDGERRVRVLEKVVGDSTIVVQPTTPPVDTNYMELFFTIDALKRSGAEFVTAVVPYLGYQRQDHIFRDGEAVSLEVIAKTLESTGLDCLIVCDLHTIKAPEVFTIPVKHVSALPLFAKEIRVILNKNEGSQSTNRDSSQAQNDNWKNTVLVSPDMGGIRRVKILSELLENMPYVAIEKDRDLATGFVTAEGISEGSLKGKKRAIIVDDMISSGKTIVAAEQILSSQGIEETYVFATHAVFSDIAPKLLEKSDVKKVFVTDTVFIPEKKIFSKLAVLSIAGIIAQELQ